MRLSESDKSRQNNNACILGEDPNGIASPHYYKDKSKKWLKFVTKVIALSMLLQYVAVFLPWKN